MDNIRSNLRSAIESVIYNDVDINIGVAVHDTIRSSSVRVIRMTIHEEICEEIFHGG
jgi:hypothetical protein